MPSTDIQDVLSCDIVYATKMYVDAVGKASVSIRIKNRLQSDAIILCTI